MAGGLPLCTSCNVEDKQLTNVTVGEKFYYDKYSDASAGWIMTASILIFFMKAGFLFVEDAFVSEPSQRRRVVISKYLDTCTSAIAFWLFGYAVSLGFNPAVLGEDQDYIFWFFRFTFASNTATIIGGTLIGQRRNMKLIAVFLYVFMISSVIHPFVVQQLWSDVGILSVFKFCNGTVGLSSPRRLTLHHTFMHNPSSTFVLDFAGSGVVHLLGGMGGFFLSVFYKIEEHFENRNKKGKNTEKRSSEQLPPLDIARAETDNEILPMDMGEQPQVPKNFWEWMYHVGPEHIEYAALGVLILWTTWFAFNCGSTESISSGKNIHNSFKIYHAITGRIALNMVVCAGSGGLMAIIIAGIVQLTTEAESINTNEISNGILSCLVAITGCCAFVNPGTSLGIGVVAVWFYHLGCYIEYRLDLKDSARVVPVHVLNGILGLLAGACAEERYVRDVYENFCACQSLDLSHINFGFGRILLRQLIGIGFIIAWSLATIAPLFMILSAIRSHFIAKVIGIRDFAQHSIVHKLIGNGALLTSPRSGITDYTTSVQT